MHKKIIGFVMFIIMIHFTTAYAKGTKLEVDGKWQIEFQDNSAYKNEKYDDSKWEQTSFAHAKIYSEINKRNKFYWVRKKVFIPSTLSNDELMVYLDNLTNGHELYINGTLVGKTLVGPNHYFNEWNLKHTYFIPKNIIHFDKENVLAIRSYSSYEYGIGGKVILGDYSELMNKQNYAAAFTVYIYFGFCVLVFCFGMYFLTIYIRIKVEKKHLYFSLMCLCSSLYYTNFIVYKLPISYLCFQKIIFLSLHGILIFAIPFIKTFLNMEFTKFDKYICIAIAASSLIGTTISTDLIQLYYFRNRYLVVFILLFLYFLIITFKAMMSKDKAVIKLGIAIVLASFCAFYDTIYELAEKQPGFGFPIYGFAFVIFLIPISIDLVNEYNNFYINSCTDGLTGLYNHIYFENTLSNYVKHKKSERISLILLDIDNFKNFNDTYGHTTGDQVLKYVSKTIKDMSIKNSIGVRYGGEEFVVLLNNFSDIEAVKLAEELRNAIEKQEHKLNLNTKLSVTVSIGVATTTIDVNTFSVEEFINEADKALYHSKKTGKNKTTHYSWMV